MARFTRIDSQICTDCLILANRFGVPDPNPFFCESRFWEQKIANRRSEVIRVNRSHVMKIVVFLRIDSRESPGDSRCESPDHLSYEHMPGRFLARWPGNERYKESMHPWVEPKWSINVGSQDEDLSAPPSQRMKLRILMRPETPPTNFSPFQESVFSGGLHFQVLFVSSKKQSNTPESAAYSRSQILGTVDYLHFRVCCGQGKSKVLVFFWVWSFNVHAPYILSADDLDDFSGVL